MSIAYDHNELMAAIIKSNHGWELTERERDILKHYDQDYGSLSVLPGPHAFQE